MNNFLKYENRFVTPRFKASRVKAGSDWTREFMKKQAKKMGQAFFVPEQWERWWPEATVRYGFMYTIVEEAQKGYYVCILAQEKPDWLK